MNQKQRELLLKRKETIERQIGINFIVVIAAIIVWLVFFNGSLIIGAVGLLFLALTVPNYWQLRKEIEEIDIKLA
jgi:hypothetical protein